jgi:hypothetical protein
MGPRLSAEMASKNSLGKKLRIPDFSASALKGRNVSHRKRLKYTSPQLDHRIAE